MSLIELSERGTKPKTEVTTSLGFAYSVQRSPEDQFRQLRIMTHVEAEQERRKAGREQSSGPKVKAPAVSDEQVSELAEAMAAGVLENIRTNPLGELCTAYFLTGENEMQDRAHDIVRRELNLPEPAVHEAEVGSYTAVGALGMGLLVHRKTITAATLDGAPTDGQTPHSVWYEIMTTSAEAGGPHD